ncbi:MAG TPA: hypothetical protein VLW55_04600 [Burkholderiaceae bacterium]|nr:hypothetical protein [Burkholderiaceae bacterium]
MNAATTPALEQHPHPAPHRGRISLVGVWFSILAGPLVWSLQQIVNAGLAAHSCYPHDEPMRAPIWGAATAGATWIELIACIVCVIAGAVAWRNWRRTRTEHSGSAHHLIEAGEGRSRFMSMVGLLSSGLFLLAVLLAAAGLWIVRGCGA